MAYLPQKYQPYWAARKAIDGMSIMYFAADPTNRADIRKKIEFELTDLGAEFAARAVGQGHKITVKDGGSVTLAEYPSPTMAGLEPDKMFHDEAGEISLRVFKRMIRESARKRKANE